MSVPILLTKLFIPPTRPELVTRSRLIEKLNHSLQRKLTLISAPAGFGKTTLVTDWLQTQGDDVSSPFLLGWLSLDEGDNDVVRFLTYLINAFNRIQGLETEIGVGALQMLQSPQPPQPETTLIAVINEIALVTDKIVLILDDYHLIDSQQVHESLNFLIENLPPQLHLVITTREDPPIPISRLRARGQLNELRAVDLRFTVEETAVFLNQIMGLYLSAADIVTLETRTEGWIAGLQMVAVSMQGSQDVDGFIKSFTGSHRYVLDYLIEEVLEQQTEEIQNFLLQTSILERLNGSLCDALTGGNNSQQVLETLDRANLFIVPLDEERRWYRYHHLFADLLRQRLNTLINFQEIKILHQRASEWYEENEYLVKAVDQAIAAQDYENAIRLILDGVEVIFHTSQLNLLERWWTQLPRDLVAAHPRLSMIYGWTWLSTGHPDEAEVSLQFVEKSLGKEMSILFKKGKNAQKLSPENRAVLAEIAVVRSQVALVRGDFNQALKLAKLTLPFIENEDLPVFHVPAVESRAVVVFTMGMAHKVRGELKEASKTLLQAADLAYERRNIHLVPIAYGNLATVQMLQGFLNKAEHTCRQGLKIDQELVQERSPASALVQVELGNVLLERNHQEDAFKNLQEALAVASPWNPVEAIVSGYTGLARLRVAQGEWEEAFAALDELAIVGKNHAQLVMPVVEAYRAKLWAAQKDINAIRGWVLSAGLDADGELETYREDEYLFLARAFIAQDETEKAANLLARLLKRAEDAGKLGKVIEILILQGLVYQLRDETEQALAALSKALELAESENYVRIFVDEGPPMARLLYAALSQGIAPDYIHELLAAFPVEEPDEIPQLQTQPHKSVLFEPLSDRELEVLSLVAAGLTRKEIASQLILSLNTVKTHTRNIYGKLGVNNQMQAVGKARALGLLENK